MIDKYIQVVTEHLNEQQKDEIARELRANINDMLEAKCGDKEPTKEEIEAVLLELGDPKKLARSYMGAPNFLIREELYDIYSKVLRIVLICVLIASAIGAISSFAT